MATIPLEHLHTPVSSVDMNKRGSLAFRTGDTVRVFVKIQEKGKTRLQPFEGLVLARKHGREPGATFTVRRVASGVGVEKIFPLYSPNIEKIEITKRGKTRRAKLYYIRDKAAKEIRKKLKSVVYVDTDDADTKSNAPSVDEENDKGTEQPTAEAVHVSEEGTEETAGAKEEK